MEQVGARIRELLKGREWSQAELARRAAIDPTHFSRLLQGKRPWQPGQLEHVARAFGMELVELVRGTDAEGLPAAERSALAENRELADRLAAMAAENEALRGRCTGLEGERDALQREVEAARRELRARPTGAAYEELRKQHGALKLENARLVDSLDKARRGSAARQKQVEHLQAALAKAGGLVQQNYRVAEHWKKQAEANGNTLKGVTYVAAGFGLLKLLSDASGDDDSAD